MFVWCLVYLFLTSVCLNNYMAHTIASVGGQPHTFFIELYFFRIRFNDWLLRWEDLNTSAVSFNIKLCIQCPSHVSYLNVVHKTILEIRINKSCLQVYILPSTLKYSLLMMYYNCILPLWQVSLVNAQVCNTMYIIVQNNRNILVPNMYSVYN